MSRRPSEQEIDGVHKYIEYCIMHYKTKKESMDIIASQANIEPVFTQTIWEELEQQNRDFFQAYYIRLRLIDQIKRFNSLLSSQAELMQQHHPHSNASQQEEPMHQQQHDRLLNHHNLNNGSNVSIPGATESSWADPQQYLQGNLLEAKYVHGSTNEGAVCGEPWW